MSGPDSFHRPEGWRELDDAGAGAETAGAGDVPQAETPTGWRRWFRRGPRHQGLGRRAAGPDFQWPAAPAQPGPAEPAASPPASAQHSSLNSSPASSRPDVPSPEASLSLAELAQRRARSRRKRRTRYGATGGGASTALGRLLGVLRALGLGVLVMVLVLAGLRALVGGGGRSDEPRPTRTSSPPADELPAVWTLAADELRDDLEAPELQSAVDGSFDSNHLIDAGATWVVLSGDEEDRSIAAHGIRSRTGDQVWRHDLADGLCGAQLLGDQLLCAASTRTDPATGLGVAWRISLLDPSSGRETGGVDFDGWLTMVYVSGSRVLLVEQRQPAPHAVLTVLNAELDQVGRTDLRDQEQQDGLFSNNRIYNRKLPIPEGPALDRPRVRTVAKRLVALWAGQSTAFVDLHAGTLVALPRCSRLVDDGRRLWCNAGARAVAYSYGLKALYETDLNVRLAFPGRDPRGGDVTTPVFLDAEGRAVQVDPETGRTVGTVAETRISSVWGLTVWPTADFVDGLTLISDRDNIFAVSGRRNEVEWTREKPGSIGGVWAWQDSLLLASRELRLLDPSTGEVIAEYRQVHGLDTVVVDEVLVGVGLDELARLRDP